MVEQTGVTVEDVLTLHAYVMLYDAAWRAGGADEELELTQWALSDDCRTVRFYHGNGLSVTKPMAEVRRIVKRLR